MMNFRNLFFVLSCGALMFSACGDDDDENGGIVGPDHGNGGDAVPQQVLDEFSQRYHNVGDVKWSRVQSYHVAHFNAPITRAVDSTYTSSAWFTEEGRYCQSDEDIDFDELPAVVKDALQAYVDLTYPGWKLDDCEVVAREGMGIIYVAEIELGEAERKISLSEQGDILKDVLDEEEDDDDDILPVEMPDEINEALKALFPDSTSQVTIVEYEEEDGEIEVDVMDGQCHKEIVLDRQYKWVSTEYEITFAEALEKLSPELQDQLMAMAKQAGIDLTDPVVQKDVEVEFMDHATKGIILEIEVEVGDQEFEVYIENGKITQESEDEDDEEDEED